MWKFIRFELKYWLKSPLLWILLLVNTLLVMGAVSSDDITIGGGVGSVNKNAPHVIQTFYGVMSIIGLLMVTAFMNGTATRDFTYNMSSFVFSSPIQRRDYYFGKFIGALLIAIIPLLGVSIGALIGPIMPWATPERYGEVLLSGHLGGILNFAIPNTIIAGVLLYALAIIFKSNLVSWIGAMLILVLTGVSSGLLSNLDNETIAAMLDPFGTSAQNLVGRYMTVDEKNVMPVAFTGVFIYNRLLWVGISLLILLGVYARFSFATGNQKAKKVTKEEEVVAPPTEHKVYQPQHKGGFSWGIFFSLLKFETQSVIKNPTFVILVAIGLINLITGLVYFTDSYDLTKYPVTYDVISTIRGSFYLFIIGIIIFYSGVLVWRDRDAKIHEIKDATPSSTGVNFSAKVLSLVISIFFIIGLTIVMGIVTQWLMGFYDVKLGVYVMSLLVFDLLAFGFLVVLAVLIHNLVNNRYLAYFIFVVFLVLNSFIWNVLDIRTHMLMYGETPSIPYSDMNGFGPFLETGSWFYLYWFLFALLLSFKAYSFYVRGNDTAFKLRFSEVFVRLKRVKIPFSLATIAWIAVAVFVYYNTQVLNTYDTNDVQEEKQKHYELTYKQYENLKHPTYYHFDFDIDLMPYERNLAATVHGYAYNASDEPIEQLHFTLPQFSDSVTISIPGGREELRDDDHIYRIYALSKPLLPGDSIKITFTNHVITKGFENRVSNTSITQNGSFFNNGSIVPSFGYSNRFEISDKNKRKKMDLPERKRMPVLDENDLDARSKNYIEASWVTMTAKISTAEDQIAIAPGSLQKNYTENGKNVFEYALDHKSLNFFSFLSARYQVERDKWNDVDIEVYYIPEHAYNVPNMVQSMKKSLEYYTENFGPYYHKQTRIIEFPRYSSFAQAFAGTMPYSEAIGFIADLRNVTEEDIDMVYYVVAHEMAHQWWAHQVVGAGMQGAEMLSEAFAQYSSLMVMEKEYGREKMKKFLKHEMRGYLRGRGNEFEAERPLYRTERQGYIHYSKGSLVMYYLKEMIGEDQVNEALQKLIEDHAYQEPPYPTSLAALRAFREVTPDSLQYVIDDLFENITLFSNRVMEANYTEIDGAYEVTLVTSSEKFRSDSLGKQNNIPVNDYIDIAVFREPEGKAKLGEPIYQERVKITGQDNTFVIRVPEKPSHAGIDPYNYLVDRIADDNLKKVSQN